jgi:magnesium chelatase subunit D
VVGADDLSLALLLTAVSPEVGGVLVRGEKGTAKSTIVRALVAVLPPQVVVEGCRFSCDPAAPDPHCPDGPHHESASTSRPTRLVELPVGASEDRVIGSLDLGKALGAGEAHFQPGLLAAAHRGLLYVDEVNLLHDHLVDVLLDAAAMGVNSVEREGVSVTHAARIVLVGTMNPEEGELRPQLLDRFGLTVEVAASRDPEVRAEIVRRRLAHDADPEAFSTAYAAPQADLTQRITQARALLPSVELDDWALATIARVCAGFDVDGMRADIVTARAARAHAAWAGRTRIQREDIRTAARFALPHRRRRNPFDAPGIDLDLLDRLLGDDEPPPPPDENPGDSQPTEGGPSKENSTERQRPEGQPSAPQQGSPAPAEGSTAEPSDGGPREDAAPDQPAGDGPGTDAPASAVPDGAVPLGVASATAPFRTRRLTVRGVGSGDSGRRSRAITDRGRTIGATADFGRAGRLHLPATITAAAPHQWARGRTDRLILRPADLRSAVTEGRESNLVLFVVDASGSMAARRRMDEVKTAVLSLLVDAYQRRDRVGMVTFRASGAELTLPPTSSVEAAARCLAELPHGGRTPLAEGLTTAAHVLEVERIRDPRRRPLVVLVTDGRATAGPDALERAQRIAAQWHRTGAQAVVVDCENGSFRLGLAAELAALMGADHLPLGQVAADDLVDAVTAHRGTARDRRSAA